jgi:hypothetical protein
LGKIGFISALMCPKTPLPNRLLPLLLSAIAKLKPLHQGQQVIML